MTYAPFNTSFAIPTDVDAYVHPSRDLGGGAYMSVPAGPVAVHNLAVPGAPAMATYAGTAPVAPAAQTQPVDPSLI